MKGLVVLVFVFGVMLGATSAASATSAPVAAYSFDEGEGEVAADASGEHDGTVEGAKWTKGKYGSALKFNGSEEECVRIADSPDLRLSEELTIEAWVKPEAGDTSDPIIFKETGGNFTYALAAGLFHASTPEGAVAYEPNVSTETESPTDLTQNVWNHLALTYDGANLRLYLDGELVDTEKSAPAIQTKDPLAIGCSYSWDEGMTGKIDEVRIYDRALDEGELGADKGAPIQTPRSAPVAAYSFDEGEGEVAADASGEHDGTVEGPEWFGHGRYGSALHFDGVEGEQVTIPDSTDLDLTNEVTLEAWVRPAETIEWSSILSKQRGSGISYQLVAQGDHNAPVGYLANAEKEWGVDGGTTPLPAKTWSHIAFTADGGQLRFYVNGKLKGSDSLLAVAAASTGPLVIGGDTFKGLIDEVRIYDRALDEGELGADKGAPIQTPRSAPVAAYSFDEGEGEVAADASGEHDGALEGPEWFSRGKSGSALHLDGINDLVSIPGSEDLDLTDEFTLEAWVRPDEANPGSAVITRERGSGLISYQMHAEGSGKVPVGYVESSKGRFGVSGTAPIPVHVWSYLTLTYDGAKIRYYVDGALVGTASASDPGTSEDPLLIGDDIHWAAEDAFKGFIDEVRIYDRALDEGEIAADKATPIQTPARPPLAAYSFDAGEGEVAEDLSGEHDGTIEGAEWTRGKYDSALHFDGVNDLVSIPDSNDLDLTDEFTLEAWVRPDEPNAGSAVITKERGSGLISYQMHAEGSGKVPVGYVESSKGRYGVSATSTIPVHVWSHLTLTYDGAKLRYYVDGVLEGTASAVDPGVGPSPVLIGGDIHWAPGDSFKGKIDEVRIYDRALGSEEAADMESPQFAAPFNVIAFPEEGETDVIFGAATDRPAGPAQDLYYSYRYKIGSGTYSAWSTSVHPSFRVPTSVEGTEITVQAYAYDGNGNRSDIQAATVVVPSEEEAPPFTEQDVEESEEADGADDSPPFELKFRKARLSEETFRATAARPGPRSCLAKADDPHLSTHAKPKKVINAVAWVECGFSGVTGWVTANLMAVGPYGSYSVKYSGRVPIVNSLIRTRAKAPISCVPGRYYTAGLANLKGPPNLIPVGSPAVAVASDLIEIKRC